MTSLRQYFAENKLKAIGLVWASGMGASLAYQWYRPIPRQMKIIHSRIYAQAFTLSALAIAGMLHWASDDK